METDGLWGRVAARIHSSCGWWLRPPAQLGRPREGRRTWLAESVGDGGPGKVIVKASANPFAPTRARWAADAMGLLGERGYPVPPLLWHGPLDAGWFVVVQARLPGQPLRTLDAATLDRLLALVNLQADQAPRLGEGGWDISWWIGVVLFEGWEHWWDSAQPAARSPGWWTGTTSGLAAAPPTLPGCCSTGTACTLRASRGWRRTVRSGWSTGSWKSPATKACAASSATARSPGSGWPPSATSQTPSRRGGASARRCSTPCADPAARDHD